MNSKQLIKRDLLINKKTYLISFIVPFLLVMFYIILLSQVSTMDGFLIPVNFYISLAHIALNISFIIGFTYILTTENTKKTARLLYGNNYRQKTIILRIATNIIIYFIFLTILLLILFISNAIMNFAGTVEGNILLYIIRRVISYIFQLSFLIAIVYMINVNKWYLTMGIVILHYPFFIVLNVIFAGLNLNVISNIIEYYPAVFLTSDLEVTGSNITVGTIITIVLLFTYMYLGVKILKKKDF